MPDRSGQQLGNYRLMRLLGKGGFAEVYLGEHIYLKTPVAVKILHTQLEGGDMAGFLKEAQTIAGLRHPHIVRVTDFGMDGELPYLVMDYAPNGTLRQRHPHGALLPLPTVALYMKQIAGALQHAHDVKLIHRDIKPENMLLGYNNDILLSDFGIATVAHRTATQNTQMIAGTAVYMAPELFRGKPYQASDQYSLAIVVYEWLCGEPPFHEGDFIQLGYQHTYVEPEPIHQRVPSLPAEMERVLATALAKDPRQRFLSIQAFANALEQASMSRRTPEVRARPTPTPIAPAPIAPAPPISPYARTTNLSSYGSYVSGPGSAYSSGPSNSAPTGEKLVVGTTAVKPWQLGKHQLIVSGIGMLLCILLFSFLPLLVPPHSAASGVNFIIICVLVALAFVTPQFFGAVFGPWAGLFTGAFGSLISVFIFLNVGELHFVGRLPTSSEYSSAYTAIWAFHLGIALVGFISGFAMFKKRGRYNIRRALGFGSLGVVTGTAACVLSITLLEYLRYPSYLSPYSLTRLLTQGLIFALVYLGIGLILLPLLLLFYHKTIGRLVKV